MKKRRLAAEFAIQVYSDGSMFWDELDRYLWVRINEGHEKALRASRSQAKPGSRRRRAR